MADYGWSSDLRTTREALIFLLIPPMWCLTTGCGKLYDWKSSSRRRASFWVAGIWLILSAAFSGIEWTTRILDRVVGAFETGAYITEAVAVMLAALLAAPPGGRILSVSLERYEQRLADYAESARLDAQDAQPRLLDGAYRIWGRYLMACFVQVLVWVGGRSLDHILPAEISFGWCLIACIMEACAIFTVGVVVLEGSSEVMLDRDMTEDWKKYTIENKISILQLMRYMMSHPLYPLMRRRWPGVDAGDLVEEIGSEPRRCADYGTMREKSDNPKGLPTHTLIAIHGGHE